METYIKGLEEEDKLKVKGPGASRKTFSFGDNRKRKSEGEYTIPGEVHGLEDTKTGWNNENILAIRAGKEMKENKKEERKKKVDL